MNRHWHHQSAVHSRNICSATCKCHSSSSLYSSSFPSSPSTRMNTHFPHGSRPAPVSASSVASSTPRITFAISTLSAYSDATVVIKTSPRTSTRCCLRRTDHDPAHSPCQGEYSSHPIYRASTTLLIPPMEYPEGNGSRMHHPYARCSRGGDDHPPPRQRPLGGTDSSPIPPLAP
jgi:hypothetical protein